MVSLEQRQALATTVEADPNLRRIRDLLDGKSIPKDGLPGQGIHESLLIAIGNDDSGRFRQLADEIGRRKIASDIDWCQDDFLIFLLLLGNQKFGETISYLEEVFDVRRQTPNRVPQKINEALLSIFRQEFGIDSEFAFLKLPFLYLTKNLNISRSEAEKVLSTLSEAGLWEQLSPFLKLLSQKAYDLVLTERKPQVAETTDELIEGFKRHAKDLNLRQWTGLLASLPGRFIGFLTIAFIVFNSLALFSGLGKEVAYKEFGFNRTLPETVGINVISDTNVALPTEARIIVAELPTSGVPDGRQVLSFSIKCDPFAHATPQFVIEVSHPEEPILTAFAFIQTIDIGERPYTVIPVQKESGRFRLLLPKQEAGNQLVVVLRIESSSRSNALDVGNRVVLRPLP